MKILETIPRREPADSWKCSKVPPHVDHMVRQAIQHCWAVLPKERRDVPELEQQIRRMVERALKDFADDQAAFASANPDAN